MLLQSHVSIYFSKMSSVLLHIINALVMGEVKGRVEDRGGDIKGNRC